MEHDKDTLHLRPPIRLNTHLWSLESGVCTKARMDVLSTLSISSYFRGMIGYLIDVEERRVSWTLADNPVKSLAKNELLFIEEICSIVGLRLLDNVRDW
jgi:hypothetical protein